MPTDETTVFLAKITRKRYNYYNCKKTEEFALQTAFTLAAGNAARVRFLGRTYTEDYTAYSNGEKVEQVTFFDWTMSGFEVAFCGTALSAKIVTDRFDKGPIRFYVYVDCDFAPQEGRMIEVANEEIGEYTLCEGLNEGNHTVMLRRASCCSRGGFDDPRGLAGRTGLVSLTVTGEAPCLLDRPADKALKLEFIGDSITCGDAINRVNGQNVEDGTLTYAAFTASLLSADINVMSISGNGCICCLFGTPLLDLPDQYLFTDNLAKPSKEALKKWDFARYQPDVVVVNLGTNDRGGVPRVFGYDEFKNGCDKSVNGGKIEHHTGVKDFLTMIHENNPSAKIVWTCGAMGRELCHVIDEAVREWNEANGFKDAPVAFFAPLPENWSFDHGKAFDDCHPSVLSSKIYAAILTEKITRILSL